MFSTKDICSLLACLLGTVASAAERPNILLLISDDQRPDTIAALGNSVIQTPHLDRLVAEGTTFPRATCAHPLCVPARAELLTGQTGFRNGVHPPNNTPDLQQQTWPAWMAASGYRTWWVGKWMIAGRPSSRGFQESLGLFGSGTRPETPQYDSAGRLVTGYRGWMFQSDDRTLHPEEGVGLTPDISEKFADAAIEFLGRETERPFFLQVNFTAPHDPLLDPPGWEETYDPRQMPLPGNFAGRHPFDHGNEEGRDEQLNSWPRRKKDIRRDLATYYAVISHMDQQVGRILAALEKNGQADSTVVIFTSDHGLALGSHGLMGKQNMYEHTINVPLIIRGPGFEAGTTCNAQCYLRDLVPTSLELAGIDIPASVEAASLMPVVRGEIDEIHRFIIGYFADKQRMIRMQDWKYIYYPQVRREQLFFLGQDPLERNDLSGDRRTAGIRDELRVEMIQWLKNHGDPLKYDSGGQ